MAGSIFSDDFQTAIPSNDVMKQILALSSLQEATDYTPIATGLKSIGKVFTDAENAMLKDNTATARRAIQSINPQQMVKLLDKGIDPVQTLFNAGLAFNPEDADLMSAYEKHKEQSINDVTNQWVAKLDSIPHNEWVEFIQGKKPDLFERYGMPPWARLPLSLRQAVASKLENVKKAEFFKLMDTGTLSEVLQNPSVTEGMPSETLKDLSTIQAKNAATNAVLDRAMPPTNSYVERSRTDIEAQRLKDVDQFYANVLEGWDTNYAGTPRIDQFNSIETIEPYLNGIKDPAYRKLAAQDILELKRTGQLAPGFKQYATNHPYATRQYSNPRTFSKDSDFFYFNDNGKTVFKGVGDIVNQVDDYLQYYPGGYQDALNQIATEYTNEAIQELQREDTEEWDAIQNGLKTVKDLDYDFDDIKKDIAAQDWSPIQKEIATAIYEKYYGTLKGIANDIAERNKKQLASSMEHAGQYLINVYSNNLSPSEIIHIRKGEPLPTKEVYRFGVMNSAVSTIIDAAINNSRLGKLFGGTSDVNQRALFRQLVWEKLLGNPESKIVKRDGENEEDYIKRINDIFKEDSIKRILDRPENEKLIRAIFEYNSPAVSRDSDMVAADAKQRATATEEDKNKIAGGKR